MKLNYKKSLKLITLIITSLLIATASASYYRYLYIQGTVVITSGGLTWVKGVETAGTVDVYGSTATVSLSVNNGTTNNITNHLYLKNLDSGGHDITIDITDAADSELYEANGFSITIYDNSTGTFIALLNVLSTSSSYSGTITGDAVWHITFQIITKPNAETPGDAFAVQFTYE